MKQSRPIFRYYPITRLENW